MGIFSGLAKTLTSVDFYGGAATTISANIDRDRAEQKEKIQNLVNKTFDDGKILRDKNREKKRLTKEQYEAMLATMPEGIDWSEMIEDKDNTTATQELACTAAGGCEV